jgi:hypothetical protein
MEKETRKCPSCEAIDGQMKNRNLQSKVKPLNEEVA